MKPKVLEDVVEDVDEPDERDENDPDYVAPGDENAFNDPWGRQDETIDGME